MIGNYKEDKMEDNERESLTVQAMTLNQVKKTGRWRLGIRGADIPFKVKHYELVNPNKVYEIKLKNTENLDKKSPGWDKSWTEPGLPVDITSWVDCFKMRYNDGEIVLQIALRDDAEIEHWYSDQEWW